MHRFFTCVPSLPENNHNASKPTQGSGCLMMCVIMPLRFLSNTVETPLAPFVVWFSAEEGNGMVVSGVDLNSAVSSLQ